MEREPGPLFEIHIERIAEDEHGTPYVEVRVGEEGPRRRLHVLEVLKLYMPEVR